MENKIWSERDRKSESTVLCDSRCDRKCTSAKSPRGRCLLPEEREVKYLLKAFERPRLKYGYREKEELAVQMK